MKVLQFGSVSMTLAAIALAGCQAEITTGNPPPQPPPPPPATTTAPEAPPAPAKISFKRRKLIMAGKAALSGDQIKIPGTIQFESGKSTIRESDPVTAEILNTMYEVLSKNPQISKMAVEGHTDNEGPKAYNQQLSDGRSAAVMKWLVAKGIGQERLESKGYGMDKPLVENNSAANKQLNRRVEFHLLEMEGKPYTPEAPAAAPAAPAAPAPAAPAK